MSVPISHSHMWIPRGRGGWDVQRPCGREVNIFEGLSIKGCTGGEGATSGLERWTGPDQAGA